MKWAILLGLLFLTACAVTKGPAVCTLEAKQCPDGSYVGRTGFDCEFEKCPEFTACTEDAKVCPDGSVVVREGPDCKFPECPEEDSDNEEKQYDLPPAPPKQFNCEPNQRNVDACIEIYQPVCGWNDPAKIQCIKYPCAQTYSNSCFACQDENVLYYTEGECPE